MPDGDLADWAGGSTKPRITRSSTTSPRSTPSSSPTICASKPWSTPSPSSGRLLDRGPRRQAGPGRGPRTPPKASPGMMGMMGSRHGWAGMHVGGTDGRPGACWAAMMLDRHDGGGGMMGRRWWWPARTPTSPRPRPESMVRVARLHRRARHVLSLSGPDRRRRTRTCNRGDVAPGVDNTSEELVGPWSEPTDEVTVPADVTVYALKKRRPSARRPATTGSSSRWPAGTPRTA